MVNLCHLVLNVIVHGSDEYNEQNGSIFWKQLKLLPAQSYKNRKRKICVMISCHASLYFLFLWEKWVWLGIWITRARGKSSPCTSQWRWKTIIKHKNTINITFLYHLSQLTYITFFITKDKELSYSFFVFIIDDKEFQ